MYTLPVLSQYILTEIDDQEKAYLNVFYPLPQNYYYFIISIDKRVISLAIVNHVLGRSYNIPTEYLH
jgi:hypothetical protein